MLIAVILYLLIGIGTFLAVVSLHLYIAERNGYEAVNWWYKRVKNISPDEYHFKSSKNLSFIFGLVIWPIKVTMFIIDMPKYYDLYDRK